ncbi:hypothetical protein M5K25_026160 [Dendrobium thyrsiflorum]|uniref:Uncharacterized protein n=1 Tax=Dendrobium thyrsiflorum TaxID=117978 RepID=A0ABD0TX14_DENTH
MTTFVIYRVMSSRISLQPGELLKSAVHHRLRLNYHTIETKQISVRLLRSYDLRLALNCRLVDSANPVLCRIETDAVEGSQNRASSPSSSGLAELWRQSEVRWKSGVILSLKRWFGRTSGLSWWSGRTSDVTWWSGRTSGLRWWFSRTSSLRWWSGTTSGLMWWSGRTSVLNWWSGRMSGLKTSGLRWWSGRTSGLRWWSGRTSGLRWWSGRTSGLRWLSGRTSGLRWWSGRTLGLRWWSDGIPASNGGSAELRR